MKYFKVNIARHYIRYIMAKNEEEVIAKLKTENLQELIVSIEEIK